MPNVAFVRKDLKAVLDIYYLIRDCIVGEFRIKQKGRKYLPQPNSEDDSEENNLRYKDYVDRAVFYNVIKRTLDGFVGQVFIRDPVIEVPTILDNVVNNANGEGVSLTQLAKKGVHYALGYGRVGLFVDYPPTDGLTSKKQIDSGDIAPTIVNYKPWKIINWRTKKRGAKSILCLVVLSEKYIISNDGFEIKEAEQFRVLRLGKTNANSDIDLEANAATRDVYTVEIWRSNKGVWGIAEEYQPKDHKEKFLDFIPFKFPGSENNDPEIDSIPMYDIASLNIGHWRNSADYEESSFITGQPTPYFTGLTQEWVEVVLKGKITLGARGGIPLPENSTAGLLQMTANLIPFEAMQHKERQMVALGAKLVEQKAVQRTATEANIEEASENSILSSSAKNISDAYTWALEVCALFTGAETSGIKFELNSDFNISKMTAQERQQVISTWQAEAITTGEMRELFRKSGHATLSDEEFLKQIKIEHKEKINSEANEQTNDKTKLANKSP